MRGSTNEVAHRLADEAFKTSSIFEWFNCNVPLWLSNLVLNDTLSIM